MLTPELRLALAMLACYRLAQLVAIDDGPGDVFRRLRARAGSLESDWARSILGGLVHCVYCLGLWFAFLLTPLVMWPGAIGDMILTALGIAGVQAWLQGPRDVGEDETWR